MPMLILVYFNDFLISIILTDYNVARLNDILPFYTNHQKER